jgi:hypothetical protein
MASLDSPTVYVAIAACKTNVFGSTTVLETSTGGLVRLYASLVADRNAEVKLM